MCKFQRMRLLPAEKPLATAPGVGEVFDVELENAPVAKSNKLIQPNVNED